MSSTQATRPAEFTRNVLNIDPAVTVAAAECAVRDIIFRQLKRKGAVVAISGGVDSAVVAALCCRAIGKNRVLGLMLPEADSSADSLRLSRVLAESLGIQTELEDITPILQGARCYERRDEAIRKVIPGYGEGFKSKIVLPDSLDGSPYSLFSVVVQAPDGKLTKCRLNFEAYMGIVAATSFKQRTRAMIEYYYADRYSYAVVGTPNRLEYELGFFVKNGDGAADLKPIAHLYKSQIYQLAAYLNVPSEIQNRTPTTDTYSLPQSQEEFYFVLPLEKLDLCLYGLDAGIRPADIAQEVGLTMQQIEQVYHLICARRAIAQYLHAPALLAHPIQD